VSSVVDDTNLELVGLSSLEFVTIGGEYFLFAAAEADGAITSFQITADSTPQLVDTVVFNASSGTFAVSDLTLVDVAGRLTLLPLTRYDDNMATYHIDMAGNISAPVVQSGGTVLRNLIATETMIIGGNTYLFTSEKGLSGIASYLMQPTHSFSNQIIYSANDFDFLGDVAAFASITIGVETYLFTASAFDAGLSSFSVAQNGTLSIRNNVAPNDASGFHLPQALETIMVSGQNFLVMASAGTNSLTVYAIGVGGTLTEIDHLIDSIGTRFEDASILESFTHSGRSYILAAGSDDGLTLLEISAGGKLSVLGVLADGFDTTLNNITDIEVVIFGDEVHAFVSSGTENGYTQIVIDTNNIGETFLGNTADDVLNGTELDDMLSGMAGSDTLNGAGGDDVLVDGIGRDHLFGGAGADVFQFVEDGTLDLIRDFEIWQDQIDLSQISDVSNMQSLTILPRSYGAVIIAGSEEIRIEAADGAMLNTASFAIDDFIF
jgi:Ca2+-binding RTX toxin-like protein